MALRAGRVGVRKDQVDVNGIIKNSGGAGGLTYDEFEIPSKLVAKNSYLVITFTTNYTAEEARKIKSVYFDRIGGSNGDITYSIEVGGTGSGVSKGTLSIINSSSDNRTVAGKVIVGREI